MCARLLFHIACWSCMTGLLAPQAASADLFADLEVHGFLTQGFVKTSANRFFGDSEDGSFDFTEVGVNASVQPLQNVRLSGQLLSRRAGEMYSGTPSVDYALADLTVVNLESYSLGLLMGRIKNPLGLFNETRDVAFTRPGVFVPQVIYFDKIRDLIMSSDGAGIRTEYFGDKANIGFYFSASRPLPDENVEYAYLNSGFAGDLEADGWSFIARTYLEPPNERFRASLSVAKTSMDFVPALGDPITAGSIDFLYGIASLQLSGERWTLSSEYMYEPVEWRGFEGSIFDGMQGTAEGYYLQLAWQARDDLELMFRYGEAFADRADRSGESIEQATLGVVPSHTRYSKVFATGVRWDVTPNVMLRAEYQCHRGTFVLSRRENLDLHRMDPEWDLFALSASYRF